MSNLEKTSRLRPESIEVGTWYKCHARRFAAVDSASSFHNVTSPVTDNVTDTGVTAGQRDVERHRGCMTVVQQRAIMRCIQQLINKPHSNNNVTAPVQ